MGLLEKIRGGRQYIKQPMAVEVVFAQEAGVLQTLEGAVHVLPGDALLTGVEGERWPVQRARFDASYSARPPTRQGEAGTYIKRPMAVHAIPATQPGQIRLDNGRDTIVATPGDWLVADVSGSIWVVAASIFAATYTLLPEGE